MEIIILMLDVECSQTHNFDVYGALLFFKGKKIC
jgi:hypothetical protein